MIGHCPTSVLPRRPARSGALLLLAAGLSGCGAGAPAPASPSSAVPASQGSSCLHDVESPPGVFTVQDVFGAGARGSRSARGIEVDAGSCPTSGSASGPDLCSPDWQPVTRPEALVAAGVARVGEASFAAGGPVVLRQVRLVAAPGKGEALAVTARRELRRCGATPAAETGDGPALYRGRDGAFAARVAPDGVDVVHHVGRGGPDPMVLLSPAPTS